MKAKIVLKKYFNLIEIALSIGMLAVGIISIMAIIPVSMKQDKESAGENYTADISANIQSLISSSAYSNFPYISGLPDSSHKPAGDDTISYGDYISDNIYNWSPPENGKYAVKFETGSDADTITDFTGELIIWKTYPDIQCKISQGAINTSIASDTDRIVGVNIELSWPGAKPYSQRDKKYFYFEVFNSSI